MCQVNHRNGQDFELAICPFCEEPLAGHRVVNGMHLDCDEQLHQEMDDAFGDDEEQLMQMALAYDDDPSVASFWSYEQLNQVRGLSRNV